MLTTHTGPRWPYCNRHAAPLPITQTPPLFLLPTIAVTGSEVGRSAVILFNNGIKAGVRCPDLVNSAICDPELTLSLPPFITAATGTLNAMLLPHVLRRNREGLSEKWAAIASQAGWDANADLGQALSDLNQTLSLPARLRDIGVAEFCLSHIAEQALQDNAHKTNPRPMSREDYSYILQAAY